MHTLHVHIHTHMYMHGHVHTYAHTNYYLMKTAAWATTFPQTIADRAHKYSDITQVL